MAESNATQVILTDDGIKIIKAQNTADNAAGGVTNLNDPNLMSVIEKQNNIGQFSGLTSQYNVLVQNAKDDGIDTTAVATAYNNLNRFMADILTDPDHASDIDRVTYKKYQDAYNEELSKLQNALQNNTKNKFTSAASALSQAASTANVAKSAADSTYAYANSEIAVQSTATAKAQSTADNAFSQAKAASSQTDHELVVQSTATAKAQSTADSAFSQAVTAIDNGKVTSQAVTALKDGSTLTIAELGSGLATKVSNSEYASYKDQTASQIGQMVTNGAFSAYQQTTAGLISEKVSTSAFSAYQETTARAISSKVESQDFKTYQQQTDKAINSKVSSSEYASDKTQTASQISQMVSNSAFSAYQTQTASQISQMVTDGAFSAYKTQTANLIADKVATSDFSSYRDETAKAIDSKVASSAFATYKEQTASTISSKVSTADFSTYKTQTADDINLRVEKKGLIAEINMQAGNTLISTSGQLTLSGKNILLDSDDPVIMKSANIDTLLVDKKLTAADISANTFTTNNETFTVDKNGLVTATSLIIRGATNLVYNAALAGANGSYVPGWDISNNALCWSNVTHDGVPSIGFNSTAGGWTLFAQTKLCPLNGATGEPFSASVWFLEDGSDTSLKYSFTLAFFDSNKNRIDGAYVGNTWSGTTAQGWAYKTIDNVVEPSNAKYVGIQYWAYNGHGNACFSSPMLTQTSKSTGYQPDTGNVVSAGIVDGSVVNGSIINGTTFHGGDVISNANNTAKYYPMTITPDGAYKSTYFDGAVGLQSSVESGAISYKYRSMIGNGAYLYDNVAINGQGITLDSGTTTTKDTTFSAAETETAYISLTTEAGLYLHGSNANIDFGGHLNDDSTSVGMYMNPYGNLIAKSASQYWQISVAGNDNTGGGVVARFGIDSASAYNIEFNRELDIGNLQINPGHTITSADGGDIHFAKGKGGAVDIYAGAVHYDSLVKSSLLSVKRDVKKADTAYWAQLVNSIDLATYQYKTDDNTSHIRLSSIVDDVNDTKQWQLPDVFISRDENGKLSGVDDSVLLNATLATVQEQQKEIDQLNGHNMELEARLNKLEAKLNG
ncbi:tail fiber [Lactiplantibacillus plantarum]|nr:tail fiber [Lactiplantibacillus plantarum]